MQFIEELVHHRYRKLILRGLHVESRVVNAEPSGLVRLTH
jgi:hypothetical protein